MTPRLLRSSASMARSRGTQLVGVPADCYSAYLVIVNQTSDCGAIISCIVLVMSPVMVIR